MSRKNVTLTGIVSGDDLDPIYRKRNKKFIQYKTIPRDELEKYQKKGWLKYGRLTPKKAKVKKPKPHFDQFEDDVWIIFYKMGFIELNENKHFKIPRYKTNLSKQIDVFAREEQCFCLIECKSAEKPHSRESLATEIDQMGHIYHQLESSVYSHFRIEKGNKSKFKAIRILALHNIDIYEQDLERAKNANVHVLDDSMVEYYSQLANHFGKSSKYQFLADMLPNIEIPQLIDPIPAIRGKMGKKIFYSFLMEPEKLLRISYIAHRGKTNEESLKTYQRMAKKTRLKKIEKYIKESEGIFPTSIVINIHSGRGMKFEPAEKEYRGNSILGTLYIPNCYKTAWIIDGQHRLFAYSDIEESKTATLPVIAFENLEAETQAKLFIDINGEQVKVPKNLLIDLYATIHKDSVIPSEKLLSVNSQLVKELDEWTNSPLRDRFVKIGGRRTTTRNITIAAISEEIKKGKFMASVKSKKDKILTPGIFFKNDFDNTIDRTKRVFSGYFNNYINQSDQFKNMWEVGSGPGGYVCTNSGLIALLRVLKEILIHIKNNENVDIERLKPTETVKRINKFQKPISDYFEIASPKLIQDFRSQHGQAGFRSCSYALLWEINKKYKSFEPSGLQAYIQSQDNEYTKKGLVLCHEIEKKVMIYVIKKLKSEYGEDLSEWWHKGIPKKIEGKAFTLAATKGEYKHPEKYLKLINWKDIIYKNRKLFNDEFQIDWSPDKGVKKMLDWLVKFNDIRNKASHPNRDPLVEDELNYIKHIHDEIFKRLSE